MPRIGQTYTHLELCMQIHINVGMIYNVCTAVLEWTLSNYNVTLGDNAIDNSFLKARFGAIGVEQSQPLVF